MCCSNSSHTLWRTLVNMYYVLRIPNSIFIILLSICYPFCRNPFNLMSTKSLKLFIYRFNAAVLSISSIWSTICETEMEKKERKSFGSNKSKNGINENGNDWLDLFHCKVIANILHAFKSCTSDALAILPWHTYRMSSSWVFSPFLFFSYRTPNRTLL